MVLRGLRMMVLRNHCFSSCVSWALPSYVSVAVMVMTGMGLTIVPQVVFVDKVEHFVMLTDAVDFAVNDDGTGMAKRPFVEHDGPYAV